MKFDIYRKPESSKKSTFDYDTKVTHKNVWVDEENGAIKITFSTSVPGGCTEFMILIPFDELPELISKGVEAMAAKKAVVRNPTDDEIRAFIQRKLVS